MYLLDTDHLSLIQRSGAVANSIRLRIANSKISFGTTIITYEEQTRGWLAQLAKAKNLSEQVATYQLLQQHAANYCAIPIVAFDQTAAQEYQRLRKIYSRLGTLDLKIAAITITNNAILLTRNQSDFGQIIELRSEDWSSI